MKLISDLEGKAVLIVVTDLEGYILEMYGDEKMKSDIQSLGLSIGIKLKEEEVGTNSIAMALDLEQPVLIKGTDHFQHSLHQSACFSVPFLYSGQTGGTISVMMSSNDANSFHLGLLQSAVDSIEREVRVNQQNKQLMVLNQVLIENSRNGIIITNDAGLIIELNPYAEKVLSGQKEDLYHKPISTVEKIESYMEDTVKFNRKYEDIEIKISDNIFLFDSFPIYNESHELMGAIGQFRDITDRLMLEKRVMENEKLSAIGKISAGLAHEIRNPLTSIIGLLRLVKRNFQTEQKQEAYFRIIFSELERIKNLVHQLVLKAKPDQNGISKSFCAIEEIIQDIITLMENELENKKISVEIKSTNKEKIFIDRDKIKQVFINILQNAIDAIDSYGQISISTDPDMKKSGIEISIRDDGIGMDETTLKNLFTPLFSTKEYGSGLGLSMSKNIIQMHDGEISVDSEKGKGTTFTIWLPN
ncbi:ATP-binding protein [Falsibacillus albus]|nr:ATP-binding protein [Falsibacillus albus]